jgi:hypothetical protein
MAKTLKNRLALFRRILVKMKKEDESLKQESRDGQWNHYLNNNLCVFGGSLSALEDWGDKFPPEKVQAYITEILGRYAEHKIYHALLKHDSEFRDEQLLGHGDNARFHKLRHVSQINELYKEKLHQIGGLTGFFSDFVSKYTTNRKDVR